MSAAPAAEPSVPMGGFIRLSEDEGLAHSDVRAIAQDRVGFMWFGLRLGGLTRYDGYELKVYGHDSADPRTLGSHIIWSLLVDRDGTLWIGTEGGLDRFERESDSFTHFRHVPSQADSLPHNVVTSIFQDAQGQLWVGTRGGLSRLDDAKTGRFTTFLRPPVLAGSTSTNTIRSIVEDPTTGLLWLGTSDGLAAFDPRTGAFASYLNDETDPESLTTNPVNKVLRDETGTLWALTEHGMNSFRPSFTRIEHSSVQQPRLSFRHHFPPGDRDGAAQFVRDGLVDQQGRFWLATRGGVLLLDRASGRFTRFGHKRGDPSSLSDDLVHTVFEDRAGTVWVGTYAGGVNRLRSETKPFRIHRNDPADPRTLSEDRVAGLAVDRAGRIWAATVNGLNRLDADGWTRFLNDPDRADSLPNNDLAVVAAAPNGDLWIGSTFAGVIRFDQRHFRRYPTLPVTAPAPSGLHPFTGLQVNSILPDDHGGVWIGARAYGLDYYRDGLFRHYAPERTGPGQTLQPTRNAVFGLIRPDGSLWYATEVSGLVRFEPQTQHFTAYLPPVEQPGATRSLHCIADGGDDVIWLGAADGLLKFDVKRREFVGQYSTKHGLPHESVMTIVRDRRGHLWLGTANGLAELDPATDRIRSYDRADGLPTNVFSQRAGVLRPDGRVFLGTRAGIVEFAPEELRDNPVPPAVVLTELRWIGPPPLDARGERPERVSNIGEDIRVPPGQLGFSLRFSALDFAAPEKNQFRYRLQGWEENWNPTTARERRATYTALPPGNYVFQVQGSNADGAWNNAGASVRVIVEPKLWQTLWFRIVMALGGVGLVVTGLQWRLRRVRQHNVELERQVSLRTAQLQSEMFVRERAEAALRESYAELENRVQARTAELARANQDLQAESAERQHVEAQLRQAQKMEAIGQLAGGIAHDFNNLLTVILGQGELLTEPELSATERDTAVRDIKSAAQRASNLTRQLLVFSRHQAMAPIALDLNEVVAGVIKLLRHMIGERVALESSLCEGPLATLADPGMLEQVLLNLAVNARDAMPRGGRLSLITARVTVGAEHRRQQPRAKPGEYVRVSVSDTGCGIPEPVLAQMFEPFFTTKPAGKGTGLGLAISLGIVLQHHGWIDVETALERGTTFHVYLPSHRGDAADAAVEPEARKCATGSGTVLVVEDEEAVRTLVQRVLTRLGYRVIEATSGADALACWREHQGEIKVLLTDVVMPGHPDGHELAAALALEAPALRIVLMSGYDPGEMNASGGTLRPHLRKPFTADELLRAIEGGGEG
ncbi:two-component regulator propeller domain-containing protein [Opitutus terrae]|uniref:histidine kinase n=1 Tax=Opitutus terrae (strain DSM 11246 / JCM 15787 / PB90-1) TaxID=452637 RepID=B1ZRD3_OPITP|nr:two-component regulator propeller domain-containing protein [Opitutus terrae]ACB74620.1 histidine kinase [Opitutus terrae PB90-1]